MLKLATITKERIPTALTGGFLAALTVLVGGYVVKQFHAPYILNFGAWGIFITWAGYFAAGGGGPGKTKEVYKKMYFPIFWGSIWGLAAGVGFYYFNPHLTNNWTLLTVDGIVIFLVNQPILWGSKYWGPLKYTPANFYGFATFFATYFGGFGLEATGPDHIYIAWACGLLMNFLGPIWGYLQVYLSFPKKVEVPDTPSPATPLAG